MVRSRWEENCVRLTPIGALVGGSAALLLFGTLQFEPLLFPSWNMWLVHLYLPPFLPAAGAFLACSCTHPTPRGWPFVRVGSALGAYIGMTPTGMGGYDLLGRLFQYASVTELVISVGGPLALSGLLALGVASAGHRRVLNETSRVDTPLVIAF